MKSKLKPILKKMIKEAILKEAMDLGLQTHRLQKGIMGPFRLGSRTFDIVKAGNLMHNIRSGNPYGDELGFNTSSERADAMSKIKQNFESGKFKIEDFPL